MSFSDYEWVAAVIAAHKDRRLVGRTRLQKEIKLLQRLKFPTSYMYTIHYYGPYSEELQSDMSLLRQFGLVKEEGAPNADGETYYAYSAVQSAELPNIDPFLASIKLMEDADPIVLELAATYDAFRELGSDEDEALVRLRRKKGAKCDGGRAESALELLSQLGLRKEAVAA